jgi:ATP-dependent exoDNAse (exonuclease V) beta subunit
MRTIDFLRTMVDSVSQTGGSLSQFNRTIEQMLETDTVPVLPSMNESANAVRIMSIHKSKGLEFPVVILADLHKAFNRDDFKRPVLVHPQLGLGCERVDLQAATITHSPPTICWLPSCAPSWMWQCLKAKCS